MKPTVLEVLGLSLAFRCCYGGLLWLAGGLAGLLLLAFWLCSWPLICLQAEFTFVGLAVGIIDMLGALGSGSTFGIRAYTAAELPGRQADERPLALTP